MGGALRRPLSFPRGLPVFRETVLLALQNGLELAVVKAAELIEQG